VSETAKAIFMLAAPEHLAQIGSPMAHEAARAIIDAVPVDLISAVRESMLSQSVLMYALLSAHLIVFWLSQDSNVTPPVALAAFTGAAIAGTKPMETGFQSWKIAKGLYVVPLLFAYTPFVGGEWHEVFGIFFFALFGMYAFAAGIEGYMESKLNILFRLLTLAAAGAMLWPTTWLIHGAGLAGLIVIFYFNWRAGQSPDDGKAAVEAV
jgi:TRAP-type uncharacterized transport system fused permease subunit